jgi:molybdopterin synthase catalytic subunit
MEVKIQFTDQMITAPNAAPTDGAGAVAEFHGVVRGVEQEARISGLVYEIYKPMADRRLRQTLEALDAEYPCLAFLMIHRYGFVPVGEAAIYVRIESRHRTEAIRMLEHFMNRLKTDVPIWKSGSIPC